MDHTEQIAEARRLGTGHGRAGIAPYGDLDDAGSADLMTALGETGPTTADNHDWRAKLTADYGFAWQYAAGRDYMTAPTPDGVLTPRRFVLALAAVGVDVTLENFAGPGSWSLPFGHLRDGRTWILGDEADAGFVGPDAPMPGAYSSVGLLHLQVYASATENDGDTGCPVGILSGITADQAEGAIRLAWAGDYSLFRDEIGPAPLVEDLTTGSGAPMFGGDVRAYLRAVRTAKPGTCEPWRTNTCPECGEDVHGDGMITTADGTAAHVLVRGALVLGCEGCFLVDPVALGLDKGQWLDWRGDLDVAWINEQPAMGTYPHGYQPTLFGEYVGGLVPTYPEALEALRVAVAEWVKHSGPGAVEPPVWYMNHDTGLTFRFPMRLAEVRVDWDRPARLDDEIWWAGLGPHVGVEAMCLLCGQTCNPHGPGELVHGEQLEGDETSGQMVPCGGPLVILGAWG